MRTSLDVLRSFKKYVSELVLPEYEVRLSSEEGSWERPFCRVAWTTPIAVRHHGARQMECRRTMQIVAWPLEVDAEETLNPTDAARARAEEVTELMFQGFARGLHERSFAPARGRAHPFRIPIYDYAGKGLLTGASDGDLIGEAPLEMVVGADRAVTDFARLEEEPSIGDIADPNTDLSRLVIADLRVVWARAVGIPVSGGPAQIVGISPAP